MRLTTLSILWGGTSEPPGGCMLSPPTHHSLLKFRQLLPDEDPEVTYETATYFASTMV